MSYILEALKKSELERQQGRVPDLTSAPIAIGRAGTGEVASRRPYLVAAVLLLVATAALLWWRPWQGRQTAPAAVPLAPARPTSMQATGIAPDVHVDLPVALPHAARAPTTEGAEGKQTDRAAPAAAPRPADATARSPLSATAEAARSGQVEQTSKTQRPVEPRPQPAPAEAHVAAVAPALPSTMSTPPAAAPAIKRPSVPSAQPILPPATKAGPEKSEEPTTRRRMSNFSELPTAVQKSIARINVAGFSYSDDPQARMAVINDRIVHEGDEVVAGVKLEKIGSDGIILNHKGIRFRP